MGRFFGTIFAFLAMMVLVLDAKTAFQGTAEGLSLCMQTVTPALFPFLLMSGLLYGRLTFGGQRIARWLGIPPQAVPMLLIGILGGYPAGAQAVAEAYRGGLLDRKEAGRLMVICNQTGPAFLFGMGAVLFGSPFPCLLLWMAQVLSALLFAHLTKDKAAKSHPMQPQCPMALTQAMKKAVASMGLICGWVTAFRTMLLYLQKYLFWRLPGRWAVVLSGILEMTNGCCALTEIPDEGAKILLFAFFSGFGGLCVYLQTRSVATGLPMHWYLPGKLAQGCTCFLFAYLAQMLVAPVNLEKISPLWLLLAGSIALGLPLLLRKMKFGVAFSRNMVYNKEKIRP